MKGGTRMSYTHLTRDDRIKLSALLDEGLSLRRCAKNIGVSHTTISNEVRINGGRDSYKPRLAHRRYLKVRKEANQCHRILGRNKTVTAKVIKLLETKDWSPEQIAGRSELELGVKLTSPTSIYNYINPRKELHRLLPRKCNKYRRTKAGNDRKRLRIQESTKRSIEIRPEIVNTRERIGDWEADTIVGKEKTSRIYTATERKSGYLLADLLSKVSAELIGESAVKLFKKIPSSKKYTITLDNGTEFSDHELTERKTKVQTYFAHPYHSWERGTNENTNGLIRRYFPKGTCFSNIELTYFKEVISKINHRPRKRLGYKTPYEVFHGVTLRTLI
jgi:IS30 family transposase